MITRQKGCADGGIVEDQDRHRGGHLRPGCDICLLNSRKEVIQPQVPLRLPCYDFTPVADLTVVD